MGVYIITIIGVSFFAGLAQRTDYYYKNDLCIGRVYHTGNTRFFYFLASMILILVSGLRYYVGTDYGAYYHYYRIMADAVWTNLLSLSEPGYGFIAKIAILLGGHGAHSVFLASLITFGISLLVIYRNTDRIWLGIIMYVLVGCWHTEFNAVRQCLAGAFIFAGYSYLRDRKYIKYLILVFIAFLFHRSAVLMVILCFIVHRKVNVKNIIISLIGIIVVLRMYGLMYNMAEGILGKNLQGDLAYFSTTVNILRVLVGCAPFLYFFFYFRNREITEIDEFHFNLLLVHAATNIATMNSAYLARMTIYTAPFIAISFPELSKHIDSRRRSIVLAITITLYFIFWIYELSHNSDLNSFQWIFEQ